ncbi:alpha-glucosidase/alpha-galactosidase [candidate division BRC1 bacterium HGW-BRC1-1]|jgi:alpha-galactosidase|nr:MAG: alpha-glucosidase/alpha-galactosidase [candidate division BRC1 bacterium HGW-BRC1-1]
MPKITYIGAGSTVFARQLLIDVLSFEELKGSDIWLFDIDPERLATSETVARQVAKQLGAKPTIHATLDRRAALEGADYVINMIQVGLYKPGTVTDFEVPKKFGLKQTIADTLGIGGIMRALRTIPVMVSYCRDMEELCPNTMFLNYTNPMAMNMMGVFRATKIKSVGLCHSVFGTAHALCGDIGVPYEEINYVCAGINHMAFYLRFERNGEDLYPLIRKVVEEGRVPDWNRSRYEMFMRLGYFVTESSEHLAEYTPHFIRRDRPDLLERYNVPIDEYITRCENQIAGWHKMKAQLETGEDMEIKRSEEYGSYIIHSMETNIPRVVYCNVENKGLITNLPGDCVVEVPCLVDGSGVQPTVIGDLPPQLAAICRTNINVQDLAARAAVENVRQYVYQAAMFDPHTAAELTLDEIWEMVDDLLVAHKGWVDDALQPDGKGLPKVC